MARDDLIQATGSVDKILGGGRYQITLESGQIVTAQLGPNAPEALVEQVRAEVTELLRNDPTLEALLRP